MKGLFKILVFLIVFMAIGELLVRLDQRIMFFNSNGALLVEDRFAESPELTLLARNEIPLDVNTLRILVLGDSLIFGLGVPPDKTITYRLKQKIENLNFLEQKNVYILNVSRPGSNMRRNTSIYFDYVDKFRPQIVILAYNFNDVFSGEDDKLTTENSTKKQTSGRPAFKRPLLGRMLQATYRSGLIRFIMPNINKELKIRGIILPGSLAHNLLTEAYASNSSVWIRTKEDLQKIIDHAQAHHIQFIFYLFPELTMLENYRKFDFNKKSIKAFLSQKPVRYMDGIFPFIGSKSTDFALSKYDGHPNAKADEIIATDLEKVIADVLKEKYGSTSNQRAEPVP